MTNLQMRSVVLLLTAIVGVCALVESATSQNGSRPDPREIPVPIIRTSMKPLPGAKALTARAEMPDVMLMNDGTKVTTPAQWHKRRAEMKQILEYYFAGLAPPLDFLSQKKLVVECTQSDINRRAHRGFTQIDQNPGRLQQAS
jgi:hypothetical protein